jgi:hypothetical protein
MDEAIEVILATLVLDPDAEPEFEPDRARPNGELVPDAVSSRLFLPRLPNALDKLE